MGRCEYVAHFCLVATEPRAARTAPAAVKLENDTETFEHERVSSELKKQIQSARLAKKLTQAQVGPTHFCPQDVELPDWGRSRVPGRGGSQSASSGTADLHALRWLWTRMRSFQLLTFISLCVAHQNPLALHPAATSQPLRSSLHSALQLAQMINEKPQLINEYESGKAIPNPQARMAVVHLGLFFCVSRWQQQQPMDPEMELSAVSNMHVGYYCRGTWAASQQLPSLVVFMQPGARMFPLISSLSPYAVWLQILSKMSRVLGVTLKKNPGKK